MIMDTIAQSGSVKAPFIPTGAVQQMAQRAINALAAQKTPRDPGYLAGPPSLPAPLILPEKTLNDLCDVYLAAESNLGVQHQTILRLRRHGLSNPVIVDDVIPAVARILGKRWADDEVSFADVTIGTERLQKTVRRLATWGGADGPNVGRAVSQNILLIVPQPEQHTLGAIVLTDQFRRLGYDVELEVHPSPQRIIHLMQGRFYAMVGVTVAGHKTITWIKDLIGSIRANVQHAATPIVLGGVATGQDLDVLRRTKADFVANDARAALHVCGLPYDAAPPATVHDL